MTDVVCYYHDPVKAPLLRDAVLPALAEAERAGATGHVERHWLHGPHVRVRLDGPDEVAERVAARLRAHLATHPSTVDFGREVLLARARQNGIAELVPPPYEPIHPDNTVVVEPTDLAALRRLLRSDVLVDLRARCLRMGVPAVRDAVAVTGAGPARVRLALIAMTAHASRFPAGLVNGYHSFLSHLEGFLLHSDPDGVLRDRFAAVWERNAEQVVETVRGVADGTLTTPWVAWTDGTRAAIEEVFDRGELPTAYSAHLGERAVELGEEEAIRRWHRDHADRISDYHARLREVDFDHPDYQRPVTVYRFGTNMLYQLLAVCDVTPVERYLAASLVVRAVQRITGIGWDEHVAQMVKVAR
ncbi:lantibiotic biosynthesis dehydratase-like protein [Saccharothrix saharensis]|uniref:Lantibiotic biosynthesis dehydratase-like protein n=1 Tax=Saccharothrix saharensis TaxID=571190 RepID=A0A543J7B2_9PSEU|nr:lantibiotic dehydratase C-terminal domain-containing protein [Saccharothrix saharensis]TQM78715.1 lantibiotic biosynthesis dehydratase-like protein [Saccharothrix saharensis]